MNCPVCFSSKIHKDGISKSGKQKYVCLHCGRYFSEAINGGNRKKRILVLSDTHCGHAWGLTPPVYWTQYDENVYNFQKESWTWFTNTISLFKPFDMIIANGDMIDGRGEKSGSTELIMVDRTKQAEMASEIINMTEATDVLITRGTEYHVGNVEQFEDCIAKNTNATEISDRLKFRINGSLIDVRHHVGKSNIPWSELTATLRELILANLEREEQINLLIRSHIHKYTQGSLGVNQIALTTPGLQGHSRFGTRKCIGRVDFGAIVIDANKNGSFSIIPLIGNLSTLKSEIKEY